MKIYENWFNKKLVNKVNKILLILLCFFFIIAIITAVNNQIVERYFSYKLSKWLEKKITYDDFDYKYPNSIIIHGLKIKNSKPIYYENVFEAENININFNLKSYLFSELIIINELKIKKPSFFLEIIEKELNLRKEVEGNNKIIFEDNIGIAKKITEDLPDKIWPIKKKDINFLVFKSKIIKGTAFIKISSMKDASKISLSTFEFGRTGNDKEYQHYKDVLKIMLFDIFARIENIEKKNILKKIYKF